MREIKFRAKNKDTGEWVVGANHLDQWPSNTLQWLSRFWEWVEGGILDPETVGQYTGLPDKNGQEKYEGDVVRDADNIGVVFWNDWRAMFGIDASITDKPSNKFIAPFDDWSDWKVIGNIYENPELLEGK